ncbi:MAG TPA: M48 family metallopeptidase [Stellaceae bacterium]|jgi:heat shock protein HtpX|nr:M48 family metallopeptidase [Stellaceae bacterium]
MSDTATTLYNTDFRAAIARNKRNTIILFAVLLLISAIVGYVLGWAVAILELIWNLPPEQISRLSAGAVLLDLFGPPRPGALLGAAIVAGAGLVWGLITLSSGAEILASFAGARDANPNEPRERQFIDVVAEMAIAAGLQAPRAMVMETPALNAFASGSSPKHAMITATTGILAACTRQELQAVIGHEMGHVAEYDVRYTTVVAAMAGVIVLLAHFLGNIAQYSFGWGGYGYGGYGYRRERGRDEGGAGGIRIALTLVVVAVLVVLLIVAPLASKIVQMAISRQREYLADASSVRLTRNPAGLIHALQRLEAGDTNVAPSNSPVSALCIAAPKGAWFSGLFSTHPPIPDRIARLRNLGGVAVSETEPPLDEASPSPAQDTPAVEPHRHGPWDRDQGDTNQPPPQKGPWG